jgi:hypothetical protein
MFIEILWVKGEWWGGRGKRHKAKGIRHKFIEASSEF